MTGFSLGFNKKSFSCFQNVQGHVNGGFHRNGSVRSVGECHPLAVHDGAAGGHNHHLDHNYKVEFIQFIVRGKTVF